MASEKEQKSAEELKQRLAEIDAYREIEAPRARFPYYCKECKAEFWMNVLDIFRLTDSRIMPCGHDWGKMDFMKSSWEAYKLNNPLPEVNDE